MSPFSTSNSFSLSLSFSVPSLFRYFRSPEQGVELKLARASPNTVTCYLDPQRRKAVDTVCTVTRCFSLHPLLGTRRALCNLQDSWCHSHFTEMSNSSQGALEPNQVPPRPQQILLFLLFALDMSPKMISPCPKFWIKRRGCISCSLSDGNAHHFRIFIVWITGRGWSLLNLRCERAENFFSRWLFTSFKYLLSFKSPGCHHCEQIRRSLSITWIYIPLTLSNFMRVGKEKRDAVQSWHFLKSWLQGNSFY